MTALALNGAQASNTSQVREFPFSEKEFKTLVKLIYERTGIVLKDSKKNMVYSRLARRLRALGIKTFRDYLQFLNSKEGPLEVDLLINAITTNLTHFFREKHHYKHLYKACLDITKSQTDRGESRRLRIWSAGCSSGEEPYSIAIVMSELIAKTGPFDLKILASDINTKTLQTGMAGEYSNPALEEIPAKFRNRYTQKLSSSKFKMSEKLRNLITFKKLNLLEDWPMKGPFDVIFCRNVMIYFDQETKTNLTRNCAKILQPGGWLYIGHSESLPPSEKNFKLLGHTIYQRP